jgi:ATP-dependent DNA helicase 2 subunit 1
MQGSRDDPVYEGVQTSHLLESLNAALQIQKRKAIVGPADAVGILLFNTVGGITLKRHFLFFLKQTGAYDKSGPGPEIKPNTFLLQPIETVGAPRVKEIIHILEGILPLLDTTTRCITATDARSDPEYLRSRFPPSKEQVPLGDVFTSCNWVVREG